MEPHIKYDGVYELAGKIRFSTKMAFYLKTVACGDSWTK